MPWIVVQTLYVLLWVVTIGAGIIVVLVIVSYERKPRAGRGRSKKN
jgi:hypothetical protein